MPLAQFPKTEIFTVLLVQSYKQNEPKRKSPSHTEGMNSKNTTQLHPYRSDIWTCTSQISKLSFASLCTRWEHLCSELLPHPDQRYSSRFSSLYILSQPRFPHIMHNYCVHRAIILERIPFRCIKGEEWFLAYSTHRHSNTDLWSAEDLTAMHM